MNWFNGSIPDAIQRSKQQKVVFIVYVYGWCNFLNFILLIRSDVISRRGGGGVWAKFSSVSVDIPIPYI